MNRHELDEALNFSVSVNLSSLGYIVSTSHFCESDEMTPRADEKKKMKFSVKFVKLIPVKMNQLNSYER